MRDEVFIKIIVLLMELAIPFLQGLGIAFVLHPTCFPFLYCSCHFVEAIYEPRS